MTRYLTPSKVGLLVLVSMYGDGDLCNHAIRKFLKFITLRVANSSTRTSAFKSTDPADPTVTVEELLQLASPYASPLPGRSLDYFVLKKLWSITSIHSLHEFFDSLQGLLFKSGDRRNESPNSKATRRILFLDVSPLGLFIRRARVEHDRMQFEDVIKLWNAFRAFRAPTEKAWMELSGKPALQGEVAVDEAWTQYTYLGNFEPNKAETTNSVEDVEKSLEFQLDRLQRYGIRAPYEVRERLKRLTLVPSAPTLTFFVKFYDAWKAGDFTSAHENLHRYFDYTMQTGAKSNYQYALLHKSMLQVDFGRFSEAIKVLNETIAMARENQDAECLNLSLSWQNHLLRAYPKHMAAMFMAGSEKESLYFLKMKAKEGKLWSILSSSLLNEAKILLSSGGGVPTAISLLSEVSKLNTQHHIVGNWNSHAMTLSTIMGRLGLASLTQSYCELSFHGYSACAATDETLRAVCLSASLANCEGDYEKSEQLLSNVDGNVTGLMKLNQFLHTYKDLLKLKRLLHNNDIQAAYRIMAELNVRPYQDTDIQFHVAILNIEYLCKSSNFPQAYEAIEDLGHKLQEEDGDVFQRVTVLLQKAHLFEAVGRPAQGFTVALRAANSAYRARLLPSLWEAVGLMAKIHSSLEQFEAARRLLEAVLPQTLTGGDAHLCAQLYMYLGDAFMGLAGTQQGDARIASLSKVEHSIDRAQAYSAKLGDSKTELEGIAKKMLVAEVLGQHGQTEERANEYIRLHVKHSRLLKTASAQVA
ncbi:hypothetical protein EJ06DRAFT_514944 [Trichodelitschia bisporula]|uniref:Anaphase-promoting complex subunit 5 n=1 Tax=Trichodelitschia bisporula TaxID=703511 RepID=A0A6G1HNM0_9PEZI|nr:hypothetical protein EJ06DRAFT_514944 [Trichodelitschia bisporula]